MVEYLSRYTHRVDDAETLSVFFHNMYSTLHRAMELMSRYSKRIEFLNDVDVVAP